MIAWHGPGDVTATAIAAGAETAVGRTAWRAALQRALDQMAAIFAESVPSEHTAVRDELAETHRSLVAWIDAYTLNVASRIEAKHSINDLATYDVTISSELLERDLVLTELASRASAWTNAEARSESADATSSSAERFEEKAANATARAQRLREALVEGEESDEIAPLLLQAEQWRTEAKQRRRRAAGAWNGAVPVRASDPQWLDRLRETLPTRLTATVRMLDHAEAAAARARAAAAEAAAQALQRKRRRLVTTLLLVAAAAISGLMLLKRSRARDAEAARQAERLLLERRDELRIGRPGDAHLDSGHEFVNELPSNLVARLLPLRAKGERAQIRGILDDISEWVSVQSRRDARSTRLFAQLRGALPVQTIPASARSVTPPRGYTAVRLTTRFRATVKSYFGAAKILVRDPDTLQEFPVAEDVILVEKAVYCGEHARGIQLLVFAEIVVEDVMVSIPAAVATLTLTGC